MRCDQGKQHYEALGSADDARDADGITVFSFAQAQEQARDFFQAKARALAGAPAAAHGPYTLANALTDYFSEREHRGSKGVRADRYAATARILPSLAHLEAKSLTATVIKSWHRSIDTSPKLRRSKAGATSPSTAAIDFADPEAVRSRKATANRLLTILKAALNYAYSEEKIPSDAAWRQVKPHREVDAPRVRYLQPEEWARLVNASCGAFRKLVLGALCTGARYGELCRMQTSDFNAGNGVVTVRISKAGKSRNITLNDDGRRLFEGLTVGRSPRELIFVRDDGRPWGPSHQQRPIEEASKQAAIQPPATFHALRHSYASALAQRGVPMRVIADQLGHADTRITERHYAHLSPLYVSEVVRAALPSLGIVPATNVAVLPVRASVDD